MAFQIFSRLGSLLLHLQNTKNVSNCLFDWSRYFAHTFALIAQAYFHKAKPSPARQTKNKPWEKIFDIASTYIQVITDVEENLLNRIMYLDFFAFGVWLSACTNIHTYTQAYKYNTYQYAYTTYPSAPYPNP